MYLSDFLNLRPTHIQQKLGDTNISILPLSIISKLQASKIPILKTKSIEELTGWFWASKFTSTLTGISFDVSNENLLNEAENLLIEIILYLIDIRFDIPFFVEAEINLKQMEKEPETVFYRLLQSYFTTFNLKLDISNIKNEIESLNIIYKAIRNLELGVTLGIDSDDDEILKYMDDFLETLSLFKIAPNYIYFKSNNYEIKNIIKERLDIKLSENLTVFNNYSSNIYVENEILKTNLNEGLENQVFYSSIKLFKGLKMNNSIPKLLNNLYRLGDEL